MKSRILVRPLALEDITEQCAFIAQGSKKAALHFLDMANKTFDELAQMPLLGNPDPFISLRLTGIRKWRIRGFEKHLVFYKFLKNSVEIIRVLDSSRDIEGLFKEFK